MGGMKQCVTACIVLGSFVAESVALRMPESALIGKIKKPGKIFYETLLRFVSRMDSVSFPNSMKI